MSAALDHSQEPTFTIVARVAGVAVGFIVSPLSPSLHLTLLIKDAYEGILGIDGQPDGNFRILGFERMVSNFYDNTVPTQLLTYNDTMPWERRVRYSNPREIEINIVPPSFITPREFKKSLIRNAKNFSGMIIQYSTPRNIGGNHMNPRTYNSSSYLVGLLNSVAGEGRGYDTVIRNALKGYQVPGIDTPIPAGYFTG